LPTVLKNGRRAIERFNKTIEVNRSETPTSRTSPP